MNDHGWLVMNSNSQSLLLARSYEPWANVPGGSKKK